MTMSNVPMRGITLYATAGPIPTSAKNGSQSALVMMPNAPCPTKVMAAPTRSVHRIVRLYGALIISPGVGWRNDVCALQTEGGVCVRIVRGKAHGRATESSQLPDI